ncbi:MAG: NAD-dependent epimerase/dehydratase family protein [Alphaproteobacteria bacterium]
MTILVTGAAGFIGFHTSKKLLEAGESVVGIDNLNDYYDPALKQARLEILQQYSSFTFHQVDIADKTAMMDLWCSHPDILKIVHLAAQAGVRYSIKDPYAYADSNLTGFLTILELCRAREGFQHLVYASSSSVYGSNTEMPYATHQKTDQPKSLYGATKKANELMAYAYADLYKIPATGLRFFTVYGPWGRPDMAYYSFARDILADRPIKIFNNGNLKRDFTYIDDIVSGVIAAIDSPPGASSPHAVFNLGNHQAENLMDFIATIEKALGKSANIEMLPMQPGDVHETFADISEAEKILGYAPKTAIAEGIPRFIEWYAEFHKQDLEEAS